MVDAIDCLTDTDIASLIRDHVRAGGSVEYVELLDRAADGKRRYRFLARHDRDLSWGYGWGVPNAEFAAACRQPWAGWTFSEGSEIHRAITAPHED